MVIRSFGGWEPINGSSGRLHLRNGMLTLRILHATPYDLIPAPGRNKARISYYSNRAVDLFGVEASNLLAVWLSRRGWGDLCAHRAADRGMEAWSAAEVRPRFRAATGD
jgi:hypothetical protein